jgi:hypothetical protein
MKNNFAQLYSFNITVQRSCFVIRIKFPYKSTLIRYLKVGHKNSREWINVFKG